MNMAGRGGLDSCADNRDGDGQLRRVAQRTQVADLVQRFLQTLSSTLENVPVTGSSIANDICKYASAMQPTPDGGGLSPSDALKRARNAIGSNNDAYLQVGLSVLWSGDMKESDEALLYPSSAGGSVGGARIQSQVLVLEDLLRRSIEEANRMKDLLERQAPALFTYLLEVKEIADFARDEESGLPEDQVPGSELNMPSVASPTKWTHFLRVEEESTEEQMARREQLRNAIAACLTLERSYDHNGSRSALHARLLFRTLRRLVSPEVGAFIERTLPSDQTTIVGSVRQYARLSSSLGDALALFPPDMDCALSDHNSWNAIDLNNLDQLGFATNLPQGSELSKWFDHIARDPSGFNTPREFRRADDGKRPYEPYSLAGLSDKLALGASPMSSRSDDTVADASSIRLPTEVTGVLNPDRFSGDANDEFECFGTRESRRAALSVTANLCTGGFANYGPHQKDEHHDEDRGECHYHTPPLADSGVSSDHLAALARSALADAAMESSITTRLERESLIDNDMSANMDLDTVVSEVAVQLNTTLSQSPISVMWSPAIHLTTPAGVSRSRLATQRIGSLAVDRVTQCVSYATHLSRLMKATQYEKSLYLKAALKLHMLPSLAVVYDAIVTRPQALPSPVSSNVVQYASKFWTDINQIEYGLQSAEPDPLPAICGVIDRRMVQAYAHTRLKVDTLQLDCISERIDNMKNDELWTLLNDETFSATPFRTVMTEALNISFGLDVEILQDSTEEMERTYFEKCVDQYLRGVQAYRSHLDAQPGNTAISTVQRFHAALCFRATLPILVELRRRGLIDPMRKQLTFEDIEYAFVHTSTIGAVVGYVLWIRAMKREDQMIMRRPVLSDEDDEQVDVPFRLVDFTTIIKAFTLYILSHAPTGNSDTWNYPQEGGDETPLERKAFPKVEGETLEQTIKAWERRIAEQLNVAPAEQGQDTQYMKSVRVTSAIVEDLRRDQTTAPEWLQLAISSDNVRLTRIGDTLVSIPYGSNRRVGGPVAAVPTTPLPIPPSPSPSARPKGPSAPARPRMGRVPAAEKNVVKLKATDITQSNTRGRVPTAASPEILASTLVRVRDAQTAMTSLTANAETYRQALKRLHSSFNGNGAGGGSGGSGGPGGPGGGGLGGAFVGSTPMGPLDRAVDVDERTKRAAIWEDSLRELAISGDRLYTFLRTMAGVLHEDVQSIIQLEDRSMEQAQRLQREQRRDALREVNAFSQRVVDNVLGQVFRSSKLKVDLGGLHGSPEDAVEGVANSLVVVSDESIQRVQELATGSSGMGFLEANEQLRTYLQQRKAAPVTLRQLVDDLKLILDDHRRHVLTTLRVHQEEGARASMEYLAEPRNSLVIRLRNETFAAIRTAYDLLVVEMRGRGASGMIPRAYDCIEGPNRLLTDQFAQLCAYQLSHSRIFSSSSSVYVGLTPAKVNMSQLRIALEKTVRRATGMR